MAPDCEPSENLSRALVERIREELGRRRMSRQKLADTAKVSISTLEKALNGSRPFTTATIVRVETALGISLRDQSSKSRPSRSELGGYAKTGVAWLEGDYLTLRPSLEVEAAIYAYRTEIRWDENDGCLVFREAERLDAPFSQRGVVAMPNKSGHIYLYTNDHGQMRLAILGRPQITGEIYGLLTTLASGKGNRLTPVSTALALLPWANIANPALGRIFKNDETYATYQKHVTAITGEGYAKLLA
jgi:transcriptional regulator with XRE-family HTH domain